MAHVLTDESFALSLVHFRRLGVADGRGYWIAAIGGVFIPWNLATHGPPAAVIPVGIAARRNDARLSAMRPYRWERRIATARMVRTRVATTAISAMEAAAGR